MVIPNRRDFLKLAASLAGGALLGDPHTATIRSFEEPGRVKPNIILLLFDAMSARHLSVHKYLRGTSVNLERFAQRSTVYHSHYSGGNFTSTGTASMLTGLYPWGHRALNSNSLVRRDLADKNLFAFLGKEYFRLGYAQNPFAQLFLYQFERHLDGIIPFSAFSRRQKSSTSAIFNNDSITAYYAYEDFLSNRHQVYGSVPGSPALNLFDAVYRGKTHFNKSRQYPRGFPTNGLFDYKLEEVFAGVRSTISALSNHERPYFAYFHLWSPHEPYAPLRDWVHKFDDQWPGVPFRPRHPLARHSSSNRELLDQRTAYDEYIASVDSEFGHFLEWLEQEEMLETTCLIVTADHGQLFERGEYGHSTPLLFDPVIHIPLMISLPGQTTRRDIHVPTSNVDLLPTILRLAGQQAPDGLDGHLLPGLGGKADPCFPIISVEAKGTSAFWPLKSGTLSMRKGDWKLLRYFGYEEAPETFELYNISEDPFEIADQYEANPNFAGQMRDELQTLLNQANLPFEKNG